MSKTPKIHIESRSRAANLGRDDRFGTRDKPANKPAEVSKRVHILMRRILSLFVVHLTRQTDGLGSSPFISADAKVSRFA